MKEIKPPKIVVKPVECNVKDAYFMVFGIADFLRSHKLDDQAHQGLFKIMSYWNSFARDKKGLLTNDEVKMIEFHITKYLSEIIEVGLVETNTEKSD